MTAKIAGQVAWGVAYVIAKDPTEAYEKMRRSLEARNVGFSDERALHKIELLAEEGDYPSSGIVLYA